MSPDQTRFLVWAAVVVAGGVFAVLEWRWTRWPVFGLFLVAGLVGGAMTTQLSSFTFGGDSYYMQGVLISGGSALALGGYAFTLVCRLAIRLLVRRSPIKPPRA